MVQILSNQLLKENYLPIFLLTLTILCFSFILYYYNYTNISITIFYFAIVSFFSYVLIYNYLKLDIILLSYIFYIINNGILLAYLSGIYALFIFNRHGPLLYEDLPIYSTYRYIFCCFFVFIFCIIYFLNWKYKYFTRLLDLLKFPYLQEEVRVILKTLFDDFLGSCCISISNMMTAYKSFRYLYFSMHFIFVILIKVITALLFFYFVFFSGDFYILLYFIPFSFVSWVLGNLFYYHFWVIEGNKNHIQDCLSVTLNDKAHVQVKDNYVHALPQDFTFRLTPFGYSEGFTHEHYPILVSKWFEFSSLDVSLTKYKNKLRVLYIFIFFVYFFCWFYITFTFFFIKEKSTIVLMGGSSFWNHKMFSFIKRSFHSTPPAFRHYDSRNLRESVMYPLYYQTGKLYYMGHHVYGELLPNGDYQAFGMLTSKASTSNPNIVPVLLSTIRIDGNSGNQYIIPFTSPVIIKAGDFSPQPDGISSQLFKRPDIEAILDAMSAK